MNAPVDQSSFVVEVEQEVLGTLLSGGDFRRVVGILEDRHFVEDMSRRLFMVIKVAHERYNSTSVPVVIKLIPEDLSLAFRTAFDGGVNGYLGRLA